MIRVAELVQTLYELVRAVARRMAAGVTRATRVFSRTPGHV